MTTTVLAPVQGSVRDLVAEVQREVGLSEDLVPARAAVLLLHLTALLGNIRDEIRTRELLYAGVLRSALRTEQKANRAKMVAATSEEHFRLREAQDLFDLAESLVASLKYYLRNSEAEFRALGGRHQ
jgi:hypothetical protein